MSTTPHSGSDREIQQELERAKSEASQFASSAAESAKQRGHETADRIKDRAADRAEEFASALESTAEDLEAGESGEMISGYGRSMAEFMRRFAGGLREHEIEEFAGQLASFARRNPASFLAGSVALGFGVSRFLKATSTRSLEEYGYDDDDEYLLDEEDDFEFEETGTVASSDPRYAGSTDPASRDYGSSSTAGYGASSRGDDDGSSAGADYGRPSPGEYGTSSTSSSTSYGTSTGAGTWPEDRGRERPGAGSSRDHWTPSVSDDESSDISRSATSTGSPTSPDTGTRTDRTATGNESRSDEIRRNEP